MTEIYNNMFLPAYWKIMIQYTTCYGFIVLRPVPPITLKIIYIFSKNTEFQANTLYRLENDFLSIVVQLICYYYYYYYIN